MPNKKVSLTFFKGIVGPIDWEGKETLTLVNPNSFFSKLSWSHFSWRMHQRIINNMNCDLDKRELYVDDVIAQSNSFKVRAFIIYLSIFEKKIVWCKLQLVVIKRVFCHVVVEHLSHVVDKSVQRWECKVAMAKKR